MQSVKNSFLPLVLQGFTDSLRVKIFFILDGKYGKNKLDLNKEIEYCNWVLEIYGFLKLEQDILASQKSNILFLRRKTFIIFFET